ncbi:MAG: hypothetical protein HYZ43_15465, partial [Flavobacteriia bacterium]|nr:hypothetical protein [Flavobacteriia bacterium]
MASSSDKSNKALHILNAVQSVESIVKNINNKSVTDVKNDRLPIELGISESGTESRLA